MTISLTTFSERKGLFTTTIMMSRKQLATASAILMMSMAPLLMIYAHSGQSRRSPMGRIEAVFAAAHPAKRGELKGNWVLVTQVYTQQSIDGHSGPDHVLANEDGIRNADVARQLKKPYSNSPRQLYWKITFRQVANRVQVITHSTFAPWGDVEDVDFNAVGDFTFTPDFGAEGDFTYKCRTESATRIVCLFHSGGEALEFRKTGN